MTTCNTWYVVPWCQLKKKELLTHFLLNALLLFRNFMFLQSSLPFRSWVQRGVETRKEQKPRKNWEEVELQHCFGDVVTLCNEHIQISLEGAFSPHSLPGGLPVLFPCPSRHPSDCSTLPLYSSQSLQLSLAAQKAARLNVTQILCYGFTSPACLSACLEILITAKWQSE